MTISNGTPVPVPKASLFKATVDPAKAKVKTGKTVIAVDLTKAEKAIVMAAKPEILAVPPDPAMVPQAAPVGVPGVPLIKAKTAKPATLLASYVPVVIPDGLAQSIASKPSTGGGWQALMGELQKALQPIDKGIDMIDAPGSTHVLELTSPLLAKLVDKATAHGTTGGYQGILKSIVCLAVKQHPGQILGGGQ